MKKIKILLLTALLLIVSGCSSGGNTNKSTSTTTGSIVVKHAFGETTLAKKPERIVSIGWENQDVALALGIAPIAMSIPAYGVSDTSNMRIWTKEKYVSLGIDSPTIFNDLNALDFEAIEKAKPDVILAAYAGFSKEEYNMLSAIAPVIAYPTKPFMSTWQTQIEQNAKGLGLHAEGKKLILDLEDTINKEVTKYPSLSNKSAVFAWFDTSDTSSFYLYGNADPRSKFLQDMNLTLPSQVEKITEDAGGFFATVSAEQAEILNNTDIIVIYGGNDTLLKTLQKDPILGKVPAINNGSVVLLEENKPVTIAASTPTALSIPYAIEEYVTLIGAASLKVK